MRTQRIGTSYFVSRAKAVQYYADYGCGEDVDAKLAAGEIHIGKPPFLKPAERLLVIDNGTRYAIEWQE